MAINHVQQTARKTQVGEWVSGICGRLLVDVYLWTCPVAGTLEM